MSLTNKVNYNTMFLQKNISVYTYTYMYVSNNDSLWCLPNVGIKVYKSAS